MNKLNSGIKPNWQIKLYFHIFFSYLICVNLSKQGTVPRAHDVTAITSSTIENQITKLDEDDNGVVAVNLETKEKKRKVQLVGWDSNKSIILLGLLLAFDAWAALFVCFKTNLFPNILN